MASKPSKVPAKSAAKPKRKKVAKKRTPTKVPAKRKSRSKAPKRTGRAKALASTTAAKRKKAAKLKAKAAEKETLAKEKRAAFDAVFAAEEAAKERELAELREYKRLSEIDRRKRSRRYQEVLSARDLGVARDIRALGKNVFVIHAAEPSGYMESTETESPRVMVSGHGNTSFREYSVAFEKTFIGILKKTGYVDLDDAPFFRYGVMFRVRMLTDMGSAIRGLNDWLSSHLPEGASAHIVVEDKALSIRIGFGEYGEASTATEAVIDLKNQKSFIDETMDEARRYSTDPSDFMWFPFWDWEDLEAY